MVDSFVSVLVPSVVAEEVLVKALLVVPALDVEDESLQTLFILEIKTMTM